MLGMGIKTGKASSCLQRANGLIKKIYGNVDDYDFNEGAGDTAL